MLRRMFIFILFTLLIVPYVFADSKISTTAEIDIYGTAKIQHTFQEPVASVDLNVYAPESLDVSDNVKFSVSNDALHLSNAKKGTQITYLSKTLTKKDGDWKIQYNSLNPESFKLILPFSAKIKEATGVNVRSKDKTGQIIEWDSADNIKVTYDMTATKIYTYKTPFLILSSVCILLVIYVLIKKPWKQESTKPKHKGPSPEIFIQRVKGIKRPRVRQVIFAILVLAYEHSDKLIDQSKIRGILSKEGFKDISSRKSEIHNILNEELNWLIDKIESKIVIKKEAEEEYAFKKNANEIIERMRKDNLIGKPENDFK